MTVTLFRKVDYFLNGLIEEIRLGEIGLPEIQRPFVWPNTKVRDLFDSMYRGYPIGYLLFWANGVTGAHRQIGTDAKQVIPRLLIVDGQQRLTSLYAVIRGVEVIREDFRKERILIAFRPCEEKFEVTDAAIRRDPEWLPDISRLWASDTNRNAEVNAFIGRLRKSRPVTGQEENRLREILDRLYDIQAYPVTVLELLASVNEEQVAHVFVRVNGTATTLNQADFILTLMSVFWDEGRAQLEEFCRRSRQPSVAGASPFNHFIHPAPDQMLRVGVGLGFRRARLQFVYSLLRGKDLETGQFSDERRIQQFEMLQRAQAQSLNVQNWHDFLHALQLAGFRSAQMITSQVGLLYAYTFYLIGKCEFGVSEHTLRSAIARWFFMTAMTGRYSSSPESKMEEDLARLRDVRDAQGFLSTLDRMEADVLTEDYWNITLPNALATTSARSPSLFAYHAALNVLQATALFSKLQISQLMDPAIRAPKAGAERHHLFPKGYLARLGISEQRDTNQIANYAYVEWVDNIEISDTAPFEYLPPYAARFKDVLDEMYYWHALPDGWERMEYHQFLEARRKRMAQVIREGFRHLEDNAS